jgi:hypothetical protein
MNKGQSLKVHLEDIADTPRSQGTIREKSKNNINVGMTRTRLMISSRLETGYGFTSTRND